MINTEEQSDQLSNLLLTFAKNKQKISDTKVVVNIIKNESSKLIEDFLDNGLLDINQLITNAEIKWDTILNEATMLHVAAACDRADIVDILIRRGADVQAKCIYKHELEEHYDSYFDYTEQRYYTCKDFTPLHCAVMANSVLAVRALLKAGADPDYKGLARYSPCEFASNEIKSELSNKNSKENILADIENYRSRREQLQQENQKLGKKDYKTTFFGFGFGSSGQEKLEAADALTRYLNKEMPKEDWLKHEKHTKNGEFARIYSRVQKLSR